jgi:hypothetical protein
VSLDELQARGIPHFAWIIILMTDAESITEDDDILLPLAVNRAKDLGVRIYTIGLNTPPTLFRLMETIASETGGKFYQSPSPDALQAIYEDILREVRKIKGSFFLASDTVNVAVENLAPSLAVDAVASPGAQLNATLRVAGEKWHDVSLAVRCDGRTLAQASVVRRPGSPDEQLLGLGEVRMRATAACSTVVEYTPMDDPVNGQPNGADPVWLLFTREDGSQARVGHAFNVRHPDTWIWELGGVERYATPGPPDLAATATILDPGSDDVTITWDFGDGSTEARTYLFNGLAPDGPRSPQPGPMSVADTVVHIYAAPGTYVVTVTVVDDDDGANLLVFSVTLP